MCRRIGCGSTNEFTAIFKSTSLQCIQTIKLQKIQVNPKTSRAAVDLHGTLPSLTGALVPIDFEWCAAAGLCGMHFVFLTRLEFVSLSSDCMSG